MRLLSGALPLLAGGGPCHISSECRALSVNGEFKSVVPNMVRCVKYFVSEHGGGWGTADHLKVASFIT